MGFSPDGSLLAVSAQDDDVRIWVATTRKFLTNLTGTSNSSVSFNPRGAEVATGGHDDGRVLLWRVPQGTFIRELGRQDIRIAQVAFSPKGNFGGECR